MNPLRFLFVFAVAAVVVGGAHAVVALRIAQPFEPPWRKLIYAAAALHAVALPTLLVIGRFSTNSDVRDVLAGSAFVMMGAFSLVFAGVVALELVKGMAWVIDAAGGLLLDRRPIDDALPPDPAKRRTLLAGLHVGMLGAAGAHMVNAALTNARGFRIVHVDVPVRGLPKALEGFRIVQVSDVHVGPMIRQDFVRNMVEAMNDLNPDLVAITGDLVDGSVAELAKDVAPLAELQARHGSVLITGNHEYYSGVHEWLDHVRSLGIRTLVNQHEVLDHDGAALVIGGVTDLTADRFAPDHATDVAKTFQGAPSGPRVLLAHQPRSIYEAVQHQVDVQLSGHTHGGQYFPGTMLIRLAHPYVRGLALHAQQTWIYVSCGTAWWGPPLRSGSARAEVTLVRLVAETELARVDGAVVPVRA